MGLIPLKQCQYIMYYYTTILQSQNSPKNLILITPKTQLFFLKFFFSHLQTIITPPIPYIYYFFFNPLVNRDQSPKAKLFFLKSNFFPPTTNYPISHSLYILFFSQQSVVIIKITVGYSVVCDLYENVNTINR